MSDILNLDSIRSWKLLYDKQTRLLSKRTKHELIPQDFKGWHDSEIYGTVRRNKAANIPGTVVSTGGILPNFLLTGYIAFITEDRKLHGGASRDITVYPVEHDEAQTFMSTRLFVARGTRPAVSNDKEGIEMLRSHTDRVLSVARMFRDPNIGKAEQLLDQVFDRAHQSYLRNREMLGLSGPIANVVNLIDVKR
jgi:hypothetical protein